MKPEERHGDYIRSLEKAPPPVPSMNQMIFDKSISDEMKQKFNAFDAPYEARDPYQLNGYEERRRYESSNKDLADWTLKKLLQYHLEHTLSKQVEEGARREAKESKSGDTRAAANTVVAISSVNKALRNTTMNLGADTKTQFRYDLPSGTMKLGMTSPLVNATMDYRSRPVTAGVGYIAPDERLNITMDRKLDPLNATTNVRYGLLTETLSYGVNKRIVGPISAGVDQAHHVRDTSKDETVFRVNFGTSF